jgi:hypothetical protein
MVLFVAGERYFSVLQSSHNNFGTHPVSCPVGTGGSFLGGGGGGEAAKAAGA